jgi:hypothetical protein
MPKKSETQIFLEQVEKLDARIKNKLIEKQQWRDIEQGIAANMEEESVQSSAISRCDDMVAEIDCLVEILIAKKKEVIQTIEQLYSPTEYKLLHLRYIQYVPLKNIADMWGTEYTNITTTHGRALRNVQEILERGKV